MRNAAAALFVALTACKSAPPASTAPEDPRRSSLAERGYYGRITPRTATAMHAPPNVFRMKGWNSRSNWIKLLDVVPDGTFVEAGKEIARFEFPHEDALPWMKKRIAETQAELDSARTRLAGEERELRANADVKSLTRERAKLDTGKAGLVSDRDLKLLELGLSRAEVEEAAQTELVVASIARGAMEVALLDARARDWSTAMDRYAMFERRSHVLAPHSGWVRYGYLNHARRKLQKPDDMASGTPFVFVAADERLSVEFFVPEHRVRALAVGTKVQVRLPDDERRAAAVVREVLPFPQEIGFLRGDDELPDAREKAHAVIADFEVPPPHFSSGLEVRVEP